MLALLPTKPPTCPPPEPQLTLMSSAYSPLMVPAEPAYTPLQLSLESVLSLQFVKVMLADSPTVLKNPAFALLLLPGFIVNLRMVRSPTSGAFKTKPLCTHAVLLVVVS